LLNTDIFIFYFLLGVLLTRCNQLRTRNPCNSHPDHISHEKR